MVVYFGLVYERKKKPLEVEVTIQLCTWLVPENKQTNLKTIAHEKYVEYSYRLKANEFPVHYYKPPFNSDEGEIGD